MEKALERKIKVIWDFRGPTAANTAKHHAKHLDDFISNEDITTQIIGCHHYGEMHSIAYMVVTETELDIVRKRLKPHRGEMYNDG